MLNNIFREHNWELISKCIDQSIFLENLNEVIVKVAIIDSGIDIKNKFLVSNCYRIGGATNLHSIHGTAVASMVATMDLKRKIIITSYSNRKKSMTLCETFTFLQQAIKDKNNVINISMNTLVDLNNYRNELMKNKWIDIVRFAKKKKIKIVSSAGNDSLDLDLLRENNLLLIPAMIDGIVTVGALNVFGRKANYSNYGSMVNFYVSEGDVRVSDLLIQKNTKEINSNKTKRKSRIYGTSLSAGIVSGILAVNGSLDCLRIKRR